MAAQRGSKKRAARVEVEKVHDELHSTVRMQCDDSEASDSLHRLEKIFGLLTFFAMCSAAAAAAAPVCFPSHVSRGLRCIQRAGGCTGTSGFRRSSLHSSRQLESR